MKEKIPENKKQFYLAGKYFDNKEDYFKWVKEWGEIPLDKETQEELFAQLRMGIFLNIYIKEIPFNNIEFKNFMDKIFEFAMNELNNKFNQGPL
jgi:hypothetical protein